jgi:hypothetical protein
MTPFNGNQLIKYWRLGLSVVVVLNNDWQPVMNRANKIIQQE